jgi:tripartite-type tricarboxylate transporter receptor subunit TctC
MRFVAAQRRSSAHQSPPHREGVLPTSGRVLRGANIAASIAFAATALASSVWAQAYPVKPVKIIVPFAAGAATDALARVIANELQQGLGGSFVVENRPGANGQIAAEAVVRSAPDGYMLFITTNTSQAANPSLYKKLPYDPLRDFTPIGRLTSGQFVLVVYPGLEAKSVADLVALAKAQPNKLSYATSNSTSLVSAEWFKALANIDVVGVSYKSNPTAIGDLVAGRIPMMFADQANAVPLINGGKLRALAVTGQTRSRLLPDLPTMHEAGITGFALNSWAGVFGPAGLPQPIVDKLNAAINAALKKPEVIERLAGFGYEPIGSTPRELAEFNRAEIEVWRRAIAAANIAPE